MRCNWLLAAFLCLPLGIAAQNVPAGTIIPISLDTSLNAAKIHPGQMIRATVMQDVTGTAIHRRAKVEGRVVKVSIPANGQVKVEIRFDAVKINGQMAPIRTDLRALASLMDVQEAQDPEEMSSRGLTPETWTTHQIGGDQVYRGGGPVADGLTTVGQVTPWGVLDEPRTQPGQPCRGVNWRKQPASGDVAVLQRCLRRVRVQQYSHPARRTQRSERNHRPLVVERKAETGQRNRVAASRLLLTYSEMNWFRSRRCLRLAPKRT